jgi:hypothetical protein
VDTKAWYLSKTVWVNAITLLTLALALPEVVAIVPPEAVKYVAAVNAAANLWLRWGTATPLSSDGAPKV